MKFPPDENMLSSEGNLKNVRTGFDYIVFYSFSSDLGFPLFFRRPAFRKA